jgi:hypothetical protein
MIVICESCAHHRDLPNVCAGTRLGKCCFAGGLFPGFASREAKHPSRIHLWTSMSRIHFRGGTSRMCIQEQSSVSNHPYPIIRIQSSVSNHPYPIIRIQSSVSIAFPRFYNQMFWRVISESLFKIREMRRVRHPARAHSFMPSFCTLIA